MLFALSKIPTLRQAQGRLSRANSAREMGHPVFSRLWWGQESGHEYSCSPYGTRALLPPNPALSCRAITDRRILTGDANALRISALNRLANARNGLDERPEGRTAFLRTHQYGFTLEGSTYTKIAAPGAQATFAWETNSSGDPAIDWEDANGYSQSSLYNGSTLTALHVPGACDTYATLHQYFRTNCFLLVGLLPRRHPHCRWRILCFRFSGQRRNVRGWN
jgi:hypothetical protein